MYINFATCQHTYAKAFLEKIYPNAVVDWDNLPRLKQALSEDRLRVLDPDYHIGGIIGGNNFDETDTELIKAVQTELETLGPVKTPSRDNGK